MSKRKVSAERNTAAKDTNRRPSVTSIQTRVTAVPQTRRSRSGKSPSTEINMNQGTMTKLSKTMLATEASNAAPPKTRFNSQDRCKELRSNSSPRLKSFPAERIRKFDNPALFDSKPARAIMNQVNRENSGRFSVPASSTHNYEYGDHVNGMHHGHQHQSQMAENVYQQQIYPNYSMHQSIPQADGALTYRVHGPDRHRPNVPHGHQSHVSAVAAPSSLGHVHNGPTPVAQSSTPTVQMHAQRSQRNPSETTNYSVQRQTDWVNPNEPAQVVDLEKQPVGGRNSLLHRRAVMQERQQQEQQMHTQSHPAIYSNAAKQHMDGSVSVPPSQNNIQLLPYLTQENPRQVYQQLQNNIARQQQMQQLAFNHQMQIISGQQQAQHQAQGNQGAYYNYFTQQLPERASYSYGMTSPQDASVNQARSGQNVVTSMQHVQRNTAYPITQQNSVTSSNQVSVENPNVRSQIRPYTINVVDNVKSQDIAYDQHAHNHGQVLHMYRPTIPGQPLQNHVQPQNMIPQNHIAQQVASVENPDPRSNNQTLASRGKNHLKFTPKMIRDQELLVATMKQQGISDELMRRQFDALLKEQRRQLEYLQQFNEASDFPDNRKLEARRKIQTDEKPEWMAHITPPRISYSDFEKMNAKIKEQNLALQQQQLNDNQLVEHNGIQQSIQQNTSNQQLIPSSMHFRDQPQHNAYQMWQQQNPNWQQQTGLPPGSSYSHAHLQPHQHQHQHFANNPMHSQYYTPWQHQQNIQQPYQQAYYQPTQQVTWQRDQSQNEEDSRFFKKAVSLNDLNAKTCEPSSLLKLRLYKEVIRPQKRNNGLQDPETIQKAFEMLNNPESQKGLEYLANLNRKKQIAKLNGMQNPNEVTPDLLPAPPFDNSMTIPQRTISANGLENSRNPNNPLPQPLTYLKRSEIGSITNEYPRQKQINPRQRYSLMAEKEDGTIAPTVQYQASNPLMQAQQFNLLQQQNHQRVIPYNDKNPLSALNKSMPYKFDGSPPDHYHQMQHYYHNKQNIINNNGQGDVPSLNKSDTYSAPYLDRPGGDTADLSHLKDNGQTQNKMAPYPSLGLSQRSSGSHNSPEIREAKTIGGVTYLARKPDYIPNQPLIPENTLTANKYVQPAMIYN